MDESGGRAALQGMMYDTWLNSSARFGTAIAMRPVSLNVYGSSLVAASMWTYLRAKGDEFYSFIKATANLMSLYFPNTLALTPFPSWTGSICGIGLFLKEEDRPPTSYSPRYPRLRGYSGPYHYGLHYTSYQRFAL